MRVARASPPTAVGGLGGTLDASRQPDYRDSGCHGPICPGLCRGRFFWRVTPKTGSQWPVRAWSACSGATRPRGRSSISSATSHDFVVRYNGGANAGHTVVADGKTFKLSLLPTGVLRPNVNSVIGNGVVVYPPRFLEEVDQLAQGRDRSVDNPAAQRPRPRHLPLSHGGRTTRRERRRTGRSAPPAAASGRATRTRSAGGSASASANCSTRTISAQRLAQIVPRKNRLMLALANGHAAGREPFDADALCRRVSAATPSASGPSSPTRRGCCTTRSRPASASSSRPPRAACSTSITAPIRT